jgi:hypothetical protein
MKLSLKKEKNKPLIAVWPQCLTPVIPATWEAEIGKIIVQDQPRQKVSESPSQSVSQA